VFSKEKYDWLGHGMYFWENNYARALQWAEDKKARGRIEKPSVIGAVLFLGYCCDFLDSTYLQLLKDYFDAYSPKAALSSPALVSSKKVIFKSVSAIPTASKASSFPGKKSSSHN
jgi:hypothetical protein